MQILASDCVKQQLTMPMAIDAITALLKSQHQHPSWVKTPERLVIATSKETNNIQTGSHLSMPCVLFDGSHEYAVVKLVTICPDNPQRNQPTTVATITVADSATGETLALMDGTYVTQVRTAALSGIATKYLAHHDSSTVAVIGTGGMAYEQLNAVLTVCPKIAKVTLWNRTAAKAQAFKEHFMENYPQWQVALTVCEQMQDALAEADIINLATRATDGLFESAQIKPTAHINAVGAYQPHMQEVSNSVLAASSQVFIDDIEGGRHEAGDLIQADANPDCTWHWDKLSGQLIDLVNAVKKVETQVNKGVTVFKSVGAASFDAAVALEVAQAAVAKNMGQNISLF